DPLRGLKENVIIGRLIPARWDRTPEGRQRLGLDELEREAAAPALAAAPHPNGDSHEAVEAATAEEDKQGS
ncbi:MAG: hypothetical protein HY683_08340, partial [Chloroflexi bacterium]|nr:hypothetical protein [Chloroflexota bacterium]